MRLDIRSKNPDHASLAARAKAFLDGVEVTHRCKMADDVTGTVLLMKHNADGHAYVVQVSTGDGDYVGRLATEVIQGDVRIDLSPKDKAVMDGPNAPGIGVPWHGEVN